MNHHPDNYKENRKGENLMRNALFFDRMLTPSIIVAVYWIGLIAIVITSLMMMFGNGVGMMGGGFVSGLIYLVVGVVFLRIWCELLIVMFKIHENLRTLVELKKQ